ncbi:probable L-type lectin-domain containing receptor kinase VII.2 [Musa acuminata AAA Group]|uniref:probable L-type lectin-domain containing receptor kinase VII.2 n=1 Tax=Musa acuminata AAA Group TaxID=214697 RepID=UPI0031CEC9EB
MNPPTLAGNKFTVTGARRSAAFCAFELVAPLSALMSKESKRAKPTPPLLHLLLLVLTFHALPSAAVHLIFNGFESSDLSLYGNATLESFPSSSPSFQETRSRHRHYLSLTDESFSLGRALLPVPIRTKSSNSTVLPFAASFLFSIAPIIETLPGHGLAFLFAPAAGTLGAAPSEHLGLFNFSANGDPASRVLAVEFDVFRNGEFHDINDNHVGVDRNSLTSVSSAAAGYWPDDDGTGAAFVGLTLNDGSNYQAWVDYDCGRLNVTMAPAALGRKPRRPLISIEMDLSDVFLDEMYVGFCAATGKLVERHHVLAWSFSNSNFSAGDDLVTSDLPNFVPLAAQSSANSRRRLIFSLSVAAMVLLMSVLAAAGVWMALIRRTRKIQGNEEEVSQQEIEEWELEYWPHRIGYQEIVGITEGFSKRNLIGRGGNGSVYKGFLGGALVAVKLFSQTNEEEAKQFVAEVCTLGRLKHRNLVSLRGWCRSRRPGGGDVMILVYDYMENGSLDQRMFGNAKPLDWKSRVRILRDVSAAVLYLHEGWGEAVVIHRDVKASNVMLDGSMTGRLGDFGLAQAHPRGRALGTTRVVGSAGYLAPEVVRTGRVTAATDVYAFGVLALEVVSGRRAAEAGRPPLVAWVRQASAAGGEEAEAVVDGKARASKGYDAREAAMVVGLGLACTREDAAGRPTMRQVARMMDAEEHKAANGRDDSTSWLLDARLQAAAGTVAGAHPQPQNHLLASERDPCKARQTQRGTDS